MTASCASGSAELSGRRELPRACQVSPTKPRAASSVASACVDRSRYADLAGAIAAPACFPAIALAWYSPVTSRVLAEPPATVRARP